MSEVVIFETEITRAIAVERERCAQIAEDEAELHGDMPEALQLVPTEDVCRAVVRATKKCIAERIRAGIT